MEDQAEDIGAYIVERLAGSWKVDAEWSSPVDGGFRWWGHRLEQRITVDGDDEDGRVLRAETTVLRNVVDEDAAFALLAEINQRSGTFALCYAPARRAIVAVSTVTMNGWSEPTYHWFSYAALLQICQAEAWADVLAGELSAAVAVSQHPASGLRPAPDEMLDWNNYQRSRPEWVIGGFELVALVEQLAGRMEAGLELSRGEGADELRVSQTRYSFPLYNRWHEQSPFRATIASAIWHRDLGPGAYFQLAAPFELGESAAELVNLLNSRPATAQTALLGAWWANEGKVGFTAFLPQALLAGLLDNPGANGDDPVGIVDEFTRLAVLGQKMRLCAVLDESGIPFGDTRLPGIEANPPAAVSGYSDLLNQPDANPPAAVSGYSGLLDQLLLAEKRRIVASAAEGVPAWSPDEYRAEPLPIPDLALVDPDLQLAVFGTFNPVGPTLNVLGALWLGDGRYLLANWMRHPFSPEYTALLVLPDLEPATVWDGLVEVLPFFGVPTGTEFAGTFRAPWVLHAVVGQAFKQAAANKGELERLWGTAHALEEHCGNPWSRVSGGGRAVGPLPADPAEVVTSWWNAVADDKNFYSHLRCFPQAWDGAIRFLEEPS